ncbi:MAG: 1,6-anhydro-N-acetylmuramyl-L-alanine amidase AmpD [Mariprofundales bacterium]|nr:1,6-anhydro-N-acetylmuramyl-L-alanine amidase AmpD [Mariprofundales bacterium]
MKVRHCASPHCDARPDGERVSLIVLHAISLPPGEFALRHVRELFLGCLDTASGSQFSELEGLHVSAHCVVDRNGDITQFVPFAKRAWHAGASCWQDRECCNDFSIGIELIGDEQSPFTDLQYSTAAALCREIMRQFPAIDPDAITGHQNIAPGRKWDPGHQWSWPRFRSLLDQATPPPVCGLRQ